MQAQRFIIHGRVQGVGFRPFVSRLAHEFKLNGWVLNHSGQVEIWAEGACEALNAFKQALFDRAPPLSKPESISISLENLEGYTDFVIKASVSGEHSDTHIPPDYFVCDDCLAEMQNPDERRYRYPFINCTQCGPRYTLIDSLPYDRPNTTMAGFALCLQCQSEYNNPTDRRYHAQPLACAKCGPHLTYRHPGHNDLIDNEQALAACLAGLHDGLIVAVKGIGGYHLLCDANNQAAVQRLRDRKNRPDKPLAVLVPMTGSNGLAWINKLGELDDGEKEWILSPPRPILLVRKRAGSYLCSSIAPDLTEIGLMLPYSPLHHILANDYGKPLVATSANLSGEPVLTEESDVENRLSQVADAFLHHNRPIRRPADDSVYRRIAGKPRPIRTGRGLAPIERTLSFRLEKPLLAIGADLKNTVALGFDNRLVLSPHIGELGSLHSNQVFESVISDLLRLYNVNPSAIVCDAHPNYFSNRWAHRQPQPVIPIFHHHAHASALAGEHNVESPLLVFTWDGTGYGQDGKIWGGETLLGSPGRWLRVGSIRPFYLPGGDKASREPWRCAASVCWELGLEWADAPQQSGLLRQVWEKRLNCPSTSSVGRLFDAAAALVGIGQNSSYEGHAAMRLESLCTSDSESIAMPLTVDSGGLLISDWEPLIPMLMDTSLNARQRSSVFHASLAGAIVNQAEIIREQHEINSVGLSGGVFQNRALVEQTQASLLELGFEVYLHESIPAGDGGISFGQIIESASNSHQL